MKPYRHRSRIPMGCHYPCRQCKTPNQLTSGEHAYDYVCDQCSIPSPRAKSRFNRILTELRKVAPRHGVKITETHLVIGNQRIEYMITEKWREIKNQPDDNTYGVVTRGPMQPSGELVLTLQHFRNWHDTASVLIEDRIEEIVANTVLFVPRLVENLAKEAEQQRQKEIDVQQSALRAQRFMKQQQVWGSFQHVAQNWQNAQQLRAFTSAIPDQSGEFVAWALDQIQRLDPLLNGELTELMRRHKDIQN